MAIAGNLIASDPPEWLRPYLLWAPQVFMVGSLLVMGAGATVYLLDRPGHASARAERNTRDRSRLLERFSGRLRTCCGSRLGEAEGMLLVVGTPGAGKSRLLAERAHELVTRANKDPDERVPVVVSLASWTADQLLAEWLASELRNRHEVPLELGRASVAAGQVLPLLDGLDETVDPAACVDAINDFRISHGLVPLAVCCRLADYERLKARLRLRGAIELQPPTREQVKDYLTQAGLALPDVEEALGGEQGWELLESPLTLSVVVRTYQAQPEALRCASGTADQRRARLFDAYVDAMLTRERSQPAPGELAPTPVYPRQQTLAWLGWLARGMREHHQTQLRLDRLQPSWLATSAERRTMKRCVRLAVGLVIGLAVGLEFGGLACVQHLVLRTLLVRAGCTPWRYVDFLDYAADRVLLRRVGGAYEFIHPLLREHLAAMPFHPSGHGVQALPSERSPA
jgi:hypothetical protein